MEKIKNKKILFILLIALVIILSVSLIVVLVTKDKGISGVGTNNKGIDNIFTKNEVKLLKQRQVN